MIRLLDFGAKTEYAIHSLARLAQMGEGAIATVKDLAAETGISVHFLYNIFDALTRAGIVRPHRGVQRGFSALPIRLAFMTSWWLWKVPSRKCTVCWIIVRCATPIRPVLRTTSGRACVSVRNRRCARSV